VKKTGNCNTYPVKLELNVAHAGLEHDRLHGGGHLMKSWWKAKRVYSAKQWAFKTATNGL
jgi:hypothetical protein